LNISVLKSTPRLSCPAIRSVYLWGSSVAVYFVRAVVRPFVSAVALNVTGSNSSASINTPAGPVPPAMSTLPLGRSVAVCPTRAWVRGPEVAVVFCEKAERTQKSPRLQKARTDAQMIRREGNDTRHLRMKINK
jgi:hypothetical protein